MKMKIGRIIILSIAGIVLSIFLYFILSRKPLNDETRRELPGSFVSTESGVTHYELLGPSGAHLVVLIHGGLSPYIVWDKNAEILAEEGFQVLRYDQFGKGYSDRPKSEYTSELFTRQLRQLIDVLALEYDGITIAGQSLGGRTAVEFASAFPGEVKKVILVDSVGPYSGGKEGSPFSGSGKIRKILDRAKESWGGLSAYLKTPTMAEIMKRSRDQFAYRGSFRAAVSSMKYVDYSLLQESFSQVGESDISVLLLWGADDPVIPFESTSIIKEFIPNARIISIPGAGHMPQYEKPELVNPVLLDFLQEQSPE